jgi:hypothetical protein
MMMNDAKTPKCFDADPDISRGRCSLDRRLIGDRRLSQPAGLIMPARLCQPNGGSRGAGIALG